MLMTNWYNDDHVQMKNGLIVSNFIHKCEIGRHATSNKVFFLPHINVPISLSLNVLVLKTVANLQIF